MATALTTPTVFTGATNQTAGNLTFTFPAGQSLSVGETLVLSLDDADLAANCAAPDTTTDFVAFTSLPTVTVNPAAGAAVGAAFTANAGGCGASKTDQITLTVTTAGVVSTIVVSNIRYDVGTTGVATGATAATGGVRIIATGSLAPTAAVLPATNVPSNAIVAAPAAATLSATPTVAIRAGSGATAVSNFVITERVLDSLTTPGTAANLCVVLSGGGTFEPAPAPTVVVTPSGDTATVSVVAPGIARIVVTDAAVADTAASTFTVSGLRLSAATTNTAGVRTATLNSALPADTTCSGLLTPIGTVPTNVATVVAVTRLDGNDRYLTAQRLLEDAFPCNGTGLSNVIIARGDDFPDALAASYLAGEVIGDGATKGTGILLVDRDSATIPVGTVNALRSRGVDNAIIIGGTGAIPAALATAIDDLPNFICAGGSSGTMSVTRIGGNDRFETARNVAQGIATPAIPALVVGTADYDGTAADPDGPLCSAKRTAILATGGAFPDALVAGPVSFQGLVPAGVVGGTVAGAGGCSTNNAGFPLILTTTDALHPQAASALTNLGIEQVLILGGNSAVSTAVETAVQGINSITTRRFNGTNRLDTARQFNEFAINFLGFSSNTVSVARGDTFPDALAGGPHAGTTPPAVIALTESPTVLGTETANFFRARQGTSGVFGVLTSPAPITGIDVYGGTVAIAEPTIDAILAAILQA